MLLSDAFSSFWGDPYGGIQHIWNSKSPCPHAVPTAEPTYAMSSDDADAPRDTKLILNGIDSLKDRTIISI